MSFPERDWLKASHSAVDGQHSSSGIYLVLVTFDFSPWSLHKKMLSYTFAAARGILPGIDLGEERCESKEPP